ncbi:MAG: 50-kDa virion protein [Inoviridae sp.]|nr:MAG: 50-kDa virion protein [Inoviridae sp.]
MRYDSLSNYALDDFYRPAALVSAVILFFLFLASPAQANYIYDNRTGTWTPTSRTVLAPAGSPSPFNYIPRDNPPTVSGTGAFQNKTGGAFGSPPVNGTSRNVPVTINGTTTKPNVNKALLSRLGRGGLAGVALGVGVEALLNGIGGLISEGGQLQMLPPGVSEGVPNGYVNTANAAQSPDSSACPPLANNTCILNIPPTVPFGGHLNYYCPNSYDGNPLTGYVARWTCYYGGEKVGPPPVPFPPDDLEDAINSGYQPHPSDYPFLSSEPAMAPTIVQVEPIDRLNLPTTTTTTVDLDTGKTTTVETNIWHDFNIKDNNTNQPKIDAETTTKTDTYVDGEKTSETTITNNTGFANPEGATDSEGNRLDIPPPIDCDLFPTACAWMEWTQEEPQEPGDDLSQLLQEVPIVNETFTITGGVAGCPAPLVLNLSQFGSREVSYQPLCDLASTMKFLYLALMSFAAAVLLHRSISRV